MTQISARLKFAISNLKSEITSGPIPAASFVCARIYQLYIRISTQLSNSHPQDCHLRTRQHDGIYKTMIGSNDKLNRSRPGQPPRAHLARHARKCVICKHPEREAIDEAFIHWSHVDAIVEEHGLPSRTNLYRHAFATGLYGLRRRKMRNSLEFLIAEAQVVKVTGDFEPPKETIIWRRPSARSSRALPGPPGETREAVRPENTREIVARDSDTLPCNTGETPNASGPDVPTSKKENSNRNNELLEIGVTPTKQNAEAKSNRNKSGHTGEHE